jgi:hypothetical protein
MQRMEHTRHTSRQSWRCIWDEETGRGLKFARPIEAGRRGIAARLKTLGLAVGVAWTKQSLAAITLVLATVVQAGDVDGNVFVSSSAILKYSATGSLLSSNDFTKKRTSSRDIVSASHLAVDKHGNVFASGLVGRWSGDPDDFYGDFRFLDTGTTNFPQRFYRVRLP